MTEPTVIVTGAGGPLGVNLTRSLRSAPTPLRIIGTEANRWHLPLSICDKTYLIPYARAGDCYAHAIAEVAARESARALIPTHPVEVRAIAALRDAERLMGLGTALPASEVIALADDKAETQSMLWNKGIAVPKTVVLDTASDVERAFSELTADDQRVWVRGRGAPGLGIGGAALPCRDPQVARAWVEHHDGWGKMAASEFLPGVNLSWMGGYCRGDLVACGSRERLEYVLPHVAPSGITGAPAVSRTISRSDVADIGERAVRAIDSQPHGVYFVDLKENAGGQPLVTEINAGRCGTTIEAYTHAGYNFPWLLGQMALSLDPERPDDPRAVIATDRYWVRTLDCGPVQVAGEVGFTGYPQADGTDRR